MLRIFLNNSLHIVTTVQDQSPILFPQQFDTGFEWLYSQRTTSEQRWWGERRWRRGGWWGGRGVCSPEKWKWKVWKWKSKVWKWKSKVWKWMISRASFIFYILSWIGQLVSGQWSPWEVTEFGVKLPNLRSSMKFEVHVHETWTIWTIFMNYEISTF